MAELVTTGVWTVDAARQDAFVEAWAAFAAWASSMPGAGTLRLGRDAGDPQRFVSMAPWETTAAVHAWEAGPEFRGRMAQVLQHVDEFDPAELDVVATAADGVSSAAFPAGTTRT
jgi:heme-degrading monooxygenase HmoA